MVRYYKLGEKLFGIKNYDMLFNFGYSSSSYNPSSFPVIFYIVHE